MSDDARRPSPRVRRSGSVLGVLLLVVLASLPLFVVPSVDAPADLRSEPVDAVVVLGGGQGERLGRAVGLLPRLPEPAPGLLLSVPYPAPVLECGALPTLPDVEVECVVPQPLTTAGEAATVVALAAERGWQRLVVITSDYHVTRARRLFTRCAETLAPGLAVLWVAAETEPLSLRGAWSIATEWPSLLGTPWDHEPSCTGEPEVG